MAMFRQVCRFIDRDLTRPSLSAGNRTLLVGAGATAATLLIGNRVLGRMHPVTLAVSATMLIAWIALVGWRAYRLMKVVGIKGDRHYDRLGKHALPPEYFETDSASYRPRGKSAHRKRKKVRS